MNAIDQRQRQILEWLSNRQSAKDPPTWVELCREFDLSVEQAVDELSALEAEEFLLRPIGKVTTVGRRYLAGS